MKICIDPGHGGNDPGATNDNLGIYEKNINLAISQFLEKELISLGHECILTRDSDIELGLASRVAIANHSNCNLFVSIHCNSAGNPKAEGIETWIYPYSKTGRAYAAKVQENLMLYFPEHYNRGVKEYNFYVLRKTLMAAILVECEFINNPDQAMFLDDDLNQLKIAQAIAKGIIKSK